MIYARVLSVAILILLVSYYVMIIGQLFGLWKLTDRKIGFSSLCVPFYYWIVPQQEEQKVKRKQRKQRKRK